VRLYRIDTDITESSSPCGQAFFGGIPSGTTSNGDAYSIDLSIAGYTDTTIMDVEVLGDSNIDVVIDD